MYLEIGVTWNFKRDGYEKDLETKYLKIHFIIKTAFWGSLCLKESCRPADDRARHVAWKARGAHSGMILDKFNSRPELLAYSEFTRDSVTVSLGELTTHCLCSAINGNPFSESRLAHWTHSHLGTGCLREGSQTGALLGRNGLRKLIHPGLFPFSAYHLPLAHFTGASNCLKGKI